MAGICFFFESNDVDVWSGREIDLDAWAYAVLNAKDIDRVIVVNRTSNRVRRFLDNFQVTSALPVLEGRVVHVICPWDDADQKTSLWSFDHQTDWYVFGPASGWLSLGLPIEQGVYVPGGAPGRIALHATHAASIVLAHRYHVLGGE